MIDKLTEAREAVYQAAFTCYTKGPDQYSAAACKTIDATLDRLILLAMAAGVRKAARVPCEGCWIGWERVHTRFGGDDIWEHKRTGPDSSDLLEPCTALDIMSMADRLEQEAGE